MPWTMTIYGWAKLDKEEAGVLYISGDGPTPVVVATTPPVVVVDPPDGTGLAIQDDEDNAPFVWPTNGPDHAAFDYERQYALGLTAPARFSYANEGGGNPLVQSHRYAGTIAPGGHTDYGRLTPRAVGGMNLWVPVKPREDPLTGIAWPPLPNYLIRRALRLGHL